LVQYNRDDVGHKKKNMIEQKTKLDWYEVIFGPGGLILLVVTLIYSTGLVFIWSANSLYVTKQIIWGIISFIVFFVIVHIDYVWIARFSIFIYAGGIALLILTRFFGKVINSSRRWITIGPMSLQTSDFMKVAFIIMLAYVLATQEKKNSWYDLIRPGIVTGIPMMLIVMQPDLGTAIVFIPIAICMIVASGMPLKTFVILGIIACNLCIFVYSFGLHDYQKRRILMFVNQENMSVADKRGDGYHLNQSKISIGNGGLWGKGLQQGTQNKYGYLPEDHTDFIFAVVGEEAGFIGVTCLLLLYFFLYFLMLLGTYTLVSPFGQLVIIGIMSLLAFQTIINTCMTMGMAPITGLPCPFLSYGGSSLLSNSICIGLVISILGRKSVRN